MKKNEEDEEDLNDTNYDEVGQPLVVEDVGVLSVQMGCVFNVHFVLPYYVSFSLTAMQVAFSPVGRTRKTMKRQMQYMRHWTKEWMSGAKRGGGRKTYNLYQKLPNQKKLFHNADVPSSRGSSI